MSPDLQHAQSAIEDPEVQVILRKLAKYGLGIFLPHAHNAAGDMVPLPQDVVQVERNLVVSFHSIADSESFGAVTVGWIWDEETNEVRVVAKCC